MYCSSSYSGEEKWFGSPGHKELIENMVISRDNCGGILRVIIGIAKDEKAEPRETKECYPQDKMVMKITHLDETTCDFVVERVAIGYLSGSPRRRGRAAHAKLWKGTNARFLGQRRYRSGS